MARKHVLLFLIVLFGVLILVGCKGTPDKPTGAAPAATDIDEGADALKGKLEVLKTDGDVSGIPADTPESTKLGKSENETDEKPKTRASRNSSDLWARNNTNKAIWVAVAYFNHRDRIWYSKGWFKVNPFKRILIFQNHPVTVWYLYAKNNKGTYWSGSNGSKDKRFRAVNGKFHYSYARDNCKSSNSKMFDRYYTGYNTVGTYTFSD